MRTPIFCNSPGCDTQLGWHHTYSWGPNGCDPPEDEFFGDNENYNINDEYYCESCFDQLTAEATEDQKIFDRESQEDDTL